MGGGGVHHRNSGQSLGRARDALDGRLGPAGVCPGSPTRDGAARTPGAVPPSIRTTVRTKMDTRMCSTLRKHSTHIRETLPSFTIFRISRIAELWMLFIVLCALTTCATADERPRILTAESDLILETNSPLELSCEGGAELSWEWPNREQTVTSVRRGGKDSAGGLQTSDLSIARPVGADTGEYRCVSTDKLGRGLASDPLYVYVTSETEPLFLDADQTDLEHFLDQASVIPCRLTDPRAGVTLLPAEAFGGSGGDPASVDFDARVGFTLAAELSDYSGNVSCRAALGARVQVQSFSVKIAEAPKLSVSNGTLIISENSTLELVCEGGHEIHWSTPAGVTAGRLRQTHQATHAPDRGTVHRSTLRLSGALWNETGAYSCAYRRYAGLQSANLNASVYVYVKSDDPERFFLPQPNSEILTSSGAPNFTIPCRITDPSRALKLFVFYPLSSRPYQDFESDWRLSYDPRVGYRVSPRSADTPSISRLNVFCSTESEDAKLSFKVYDEKISNVKFRPSIAPMAAKRIQGTGPYQITCEIRIPFFFYTHWNIDVIPKIQISYPNQETIPAEEITEEENFGYFLANQTAQLHTLKTKTLIFANVSLLNNGRYSCRVRNIELDEVVNTSLTVFESGFVRLTHRQLVSDPEGVAVVEGVEAQPELCLWALLESFPRADALWSREGRTLAEDDGTDADGGDESRFSAMAQDQPSNDGASGVLLSGCLRNLAVADGGVYTLTARNSYETRSLTFRLDVLESPEVSLTVSPRPSYRDPPLFVAGQEYRLECVGTGNPLPLLTWLWRSCRERDCGRLGEPVDDDDAEWTASDDDGDDGGDWGLFGLPAVETVDATSVVSVLSVRGPPQSGVFRCLARSQKVQEPARVDVEYRLTDFPFVLPAPQVEEKVFFSDPANLTCRASIYAFTDELVWDWTPSGNDSETVNITAFDPRVCAPAHQAGYHHHQSVLAIASASDNDTGVYRCRAQKKDTDELVVVYEVRLVTKDIVPPTFTKELQPTYHFEKSKASFTLECQVQGQPRPSLAWYKDGKLLTTRNHSIAHLRPEVAVNDTLTSVLELQADNLQGGVYKCCAPPGGVEGVCSATTVVFGERPTASIMSDVYTLKVGEDVKILCATGGEPTPTVTWEQQKEGSTERAAVPRDRYTEQGTVLSLETLQETDRGKYFCIAANLHGQRMDATTLVIQADSSLLMPVLVAGITAGIICLFACICMVLMAKKLCLYNRNSQSLELGVINPRSTRGPMSPFRMSFREEFADQLPFDAKWEFPRDRLKLGAVIGQGAFGMVLKGVALGINMNDRYVPVAVKTVKSDASPVDRKALFGELKMLIQVGHHLNVVNFLGACTQDSPPLVIVEFCPYGNLCDYVRSKRDNFAAKDPGKTEQEENTQNELNYADLILREAAVSEPPATEYELVDKEAKRVAEKSLSVEDLVCFCFQVARGMEFLASRKCIHRDLAARNVLLAENNVVKICDFGLARSLYHDSDYIGSGKGLLPIKWMAPEAIFDKVFTTYSDIWSFGIFTWEVFSLGGSPYPGIQVDERFYDKMKSGYRMTCPEHCPREVYQLMLECWSDEPKDRPMFSELTEKFGELLESNTRQEYIDLNIPYQEGHYCELDFGKSAANRNPATITEEEAESTEAASTEHAQMLDGASDAHFEDPSYHRGASAAPSLAADGPHLASTSSGSGGSGAETGGQQATPGATMPEDPYKRGTGDDDDQLHTYMSVRGPRPGNAREQGSTAADPPSAGPAPTSPDDDRTHAYASIRGARPNRTNGAPSSPPAAAEAPDDRPHLYASIRVARPPTTSDPAAAVDEVGGGGGRGATASETATLLGRPVGVVGDGSPALSGGEQSRAPDQPPRRDFSTTSLSPETETLLSGQDSSGKQPARPVYV